MAKLPITGSGGLPTTLTVGGRVCPVLLPNAYNARKSYSLFVFLHSYGGNATSTLNKYFASTSDAANRGRGAVCLLPTGLTDNLANAYWNSNDTCCALDATGPVNDAAFLRSLIQLAIATYSINLQEVVVFGYSNGGMMAHTLGLCSSDLVTSVFSYAGYSPLAADSHYCTPGTPVNVTLTWGDADTVVVYPGDPTGTILTDKPTGIYQGAVAVANQWGALNGCSGGLSAYDTQDTTAAIVGNETTRYAFVSQATNGSVELWQVAGGSHVQGMNTNYLRLIELRQYATRRV